MTLGGVLAAVTGTGRALVRRAGRRGAFLLFLVVLNAGIGYSLLTAPRAQQVQDLLLPWRAWGVIWLAAAMLCAAGVLATWDRLAFAGAATLMFCWAGLYTWLWLGQHAPRGWVAVIIWLGFALITVVVSSWPEPARKAELPQP